MTPSPVLHCRVAPTPPASDTNVQLFGVGTPILKQHGAVNGSSASHNNPHTRSAAAATSMLLSTTTRMRFPVASFPKLGFWRWIYSDLLVPKRE
jgi:hypothetical protein